MTDFYNKIGTTEIYTSKGDLVATASEDRNVDVLLESLNYSVAEDEFDTLEEKVEKLETELESMTDEKVDLEEELVIIRNNLKSLSDTVLFDLDDMFDKFEDIEDNMPEEFYKKVKKLIKQLYSVELKNFGEPEPKPYVNPTAKTKKKNNEKTR